MRPSLATILTSLRRAWTPVAVLALLTHGPAAAAVGTWTALDDLAPGKVGHMLLLSDGTVMVQGYNNDNDTIHWYRLSPDVNGNYAHGAWASGAIATAHQTRVFYESHVMPDGRVFVGGGEYGTGSSDAEVYDPFVNSWSTPLSAGMVLSDATSEVLPNGDILVSPWTGSLSPPFVTLIYQRASNTWTAGPSTIASQNEATWVKLPDESILTVDRGSTTTERYIPALNTWVADASLPNPIQLWSSNIEIGAAVQLPNGKAFFIGGTGQTAIYTPSGTTSPGSWTAGASIPAGRVNQDAPAAMLPNGHILCVVSNPPACPNPDCSSCGGGANCAPVYFYEYDYLANTFTQVSSPTGGLADNNTGSNRISLLMLPDGTMLFNDTTSQLYVYTPACCQLVSGQPAVQTIGIKSDASYHLTGTGLNGTSIGAAYGDDAQMNTNYPIVELVNAGNNVSFGRTYNWSSTGIQTGSDVVTTEFAVPFNLIPGTYSLYVIANGVRSNAATFSGPAWVDFGFGGFLEWGTYDLPFNTLSEGINAVPAGGAIKFKTAGQTAETLLLNKAMTILSLGGSVRIGQP